MADTDEIVLEIESTEMQIEVEDDTPSTRKRRRRQVRVEQWSPVKSQARRLAGKRSTRELPYHPPTKRRRIWLLRKEVEAICQYLSLRLY